MGPLDDQVVREDSLTATPDGLDVAIYTHWYRALPLPSLAKVELTVDGERIDPASLAVTVNGRRFCFAELAVRGEEYWFTTDPAVLHVPATRSEDEWVLALAEQDGVLVHPGYFFDFPREAYLVLSLLPLAEHFARGVARIVERVKLSP